MKKIAFIGMIAFIGALTFTSCKKNYTCSCNIHADGDTTGSITIDPIDTTVTFDLGKTTKSKAQSACDADQQSQSATYHDFGATVKCNL